MVGNRPQSFLCRRSGSGLQHFHRSNLVTSLQTFRALPSDEDREAFLLGKLKEFTALPPSAGLDEMRAVLRATAANMRGLRPEVAPAGDAAGDGATSTAPS